MSDLLLRDGTNCLELEALLDGRYRVVQVLTTEVWGQIYLAQDTRRPSQPQCVIQHVKPIAVEPEYQDAIRHLFVREAAILEKLADHDQIPQLLACFEDEEGFYLVQEFVNGYPLSLELQPEHPWTESEVVQFLLDCLEPLAFVHNQGIRHGNLSPENLVRRVQDNKLVLVGFDSVRQLHLSLLALHGQKTLHTEIGDRGYQAPEHLKGNPCFASDVYAIGKIALQALTGVHASVIPIEPKTGKVHWQTLESDANNRFREDLKAFLDRMVHYDCKQRFNSAEEAFAAVQQLIKSAAVKAGDRSAPPLAVESGSLVYSTAQTDLAPASPPTQKLSSVERHGMTLMVGLGIGTVMTATGVGYAFLVNPPDPLDKGPQLLEQAKTKYQDGKLPQAISLAESIPITSQAYISARDAIDSWQKDWRDATTIYQRMADALKQDKWQSVLQEAKTLPQNSYWKERTGALVTQANRLAENEATQLMVKAYGFAIAKDFTRALDILKQIPDSTTLYATAQEKIREYSQKRQIQSVAFVQRAYNRAVLHDFEGALTYLRRVHPDTTVYAKAQKKIQEYTKKQKAQLEAWLQMADQQANSNRYLGALTALEKIPAGTPLDNQVQAKAAEYTDKLYVWSDSIVQKAVQEANQQDYSDAIAALKQVPLGTPSYVEAREKIQEYAQKQRQKEEGTLQPANSTDLAATGGIEPDLSLPTSNSLDSSSDREVRQVSHTQNLNPGSYLREVNFQ